jgi:DNA-binding FrmR family transcriptional regulator
MGDGSRNRASKPDPRLRAVRRVVRSRPHVVTPDVGYPAPEAVARASTNLAEAYSLLATLLEDVEAGSASCIDTLCRIAEAQAILQRVRHSLLRAVLRDGMLSVQANASAIADIDELMDVLNERKPGLR